MSAKGEDARLTAVIVSVVLTETQIRDCASDIVAAMNEAQTEKGYDIDQVIASTLFIVGCAIAQRGGILNPNQTIADGLLPLRMGYDTTRRMRNN